ncbi:hypothetical protein LguiA_003538 [Lonicera macranthoides]
MPTVSVKRDPFLKKLNKTYTDEEFDALCFAFGIELDEVTTEKAIIRKEKHLDEEAPEDDEEVIYKIEVPANRYDLLCFEGLVQALRVFLGIDPIPKYTVASISRNSMLKMHVKPETSSIRPYVVCAVLRGVTFDEARYNSFIDLQDRLHQNICRRRTLVAIGTHDLDTIEGPFTYEVKMPSIRIDQVPMQIGVEKTITLAQKRLLCFATFRHKLRSTEAGTCALVIPLVDTLLRRALWDYLRLLFVLMQVKSFRADELMEFYKSDLKLKKFLHIIEDSPVFPVLYDHNRVVLSLPPVINGAHSAITLKTKNVFIECTATDLTKAKIVLNTMVTMFSVYCESKFEVEPVEVTYSDGKSYVYPDLSPYHMEVPLSYINSIVGVSLEANSVTGLLNKMQLDAQQSESGDKHCNFTVSVPPTRSDILHACDVAEDVAIAYGFNEIPKRKPASLKPLPLNQLSDLIRMEVQTVTDNLRRRRMLLVIVAMNGYTEVLTWILCSYKENFSMLNRKDDKSTAVIIGNPRSADFEKRLIFQLVEQLPTGVVRTSLMPGILKTVGHNKDHPKPIKIFEVGDITLLDESKDVGARNLRQLAALYCGATSGFELIHGLMDRIMEVTGTPFVQPGDNTGYYIKCSEEPEFLPGRQATIMYKGKQIGTFGIVHPEVMENFGITDPCSFLEVNIENFL